MKRNFLFLAMIAMAAFSFASVGCDDGTSSGDDPKAGQQGQDDHAGHDHSAHDHSAPHGGHLIELGRDHEYHAELVDDHETDTATIYMLDADMKPMEHDAESVTLVLTAGDNTGTFKLSANASGGPGEYTSQEPGLFKLLDVEGAAGKLRTDIGGKPFTGSFEHHAHGDHDHAAHDHKEGDGHDDDDHSHDDHKEGDGHDDDHGHEDGNDGDH